MDGSNENSKNDSNMKCKRTRKESCKHYVLGPFQFLITCLVTSQILLWVWLFMLIENKDYSYERIVIGAFSITDLIAILVIFCVIYNIKKKSNDFNTSH